MDALKTYSVYSMVQVYNNICSDFEVNEKTDQQSKDVKCANPEADSLKLDR